MKLLVFVVMSPKF